MESCQGLAPKQRNHWLQNHADRGVEAAKLSPRWNLHPAALIRKMDLKNGCWFLNTRTWVDLIKIPVRVPGSASEHKTRCEATKATTGHEVPSSAGTSPTRTSCWIRTVTFANPTTDHYCAVLTTDRSPCPVKVEAARGIGQHLFANLRKATLVSQLRISACCFHCRFGVCRRQPAGFVFPLFVTDKQLR